MHRIRLSRGSKTVLNLKSVLATVYRNKIRFRIKHRSKLRTGYVIVRNLKNVQAIVCKNRLAPKTSQEKMLSLKIVMVNVCSSKIGFRIR